MKKNNKSSFLLLVACSLCLSMMFMACNNGGAKLTLDDSVKIAKEINKKNLTFIQFMADSIAKAKANDTTKTSKLLKREDPLNPFRITPDDAKKMIELYREENNASSDPLINDDYKNLNGYYMDKIVFDALFKDESIKGVRFYLAKKPEVKGKGYSVVVLGTTNDTGTPVDAPINGLYEHVSPCPDDCPNKIEW